MLAGADGEDGTVILDEPLPAYEGVQTKREPVELLDERRIYDVEEGCWSEVLDLLAAASSTAEPEAPSRAPAAAGQVDDLFLPFGLPRKAPAPTEEERERVLVETLARLLREVNALPPAAGHSGPIKPLEKATPQMDAPLDRFIEVFQLDDLAAKSLRELEDDEVAAVIESLQGRLKRARNPSAVVMTSIRGVAARVGRRYWGEREKAEALRASTKAKSAQPLQMFLGSPPPGDSDSDSESSEHEVARADPYGAVLDLDEEPPPAKRRRAACEGSLVQLAPEGLKEAADAEDLFFEDTDGI